MLKGAGRGRGRAPAQSPKSEGFFMENAPMPACWAEDKKKPSESEASVIVKSVKAKSGEKDWQGKIEGGFEGAEDNHEGVIERLNPEEELELANNDSGVELGRESELSPDQETGGGSAEVRSFTFTKLHFDPKLSQEKRREHILNWQKKRRDELVDKIRHLEHDCWSDDDMDESRDFVKIVEEKKKQTRDGHWGGPYRPRPTGRRWNDHARIMVSEWMTQKPEDFEENWLGVICPVGLRCLVIASRGKTRIITRRGYFIGEFQSNLPAGRKYQKYKGDMAGPVRGVTILDCIWSEESQQFYILDLLCWNSTISTDYDTECRQYFLKSKLEESGCVLEKSDLNPFPFVPLNYFPAEELSSVMSVGQPPFPEKVDGLLFFHKGTFYIYESSNPLCLWVHLSKVPEMLGVDVLPELLAKEREPKPPRPRRPGGRGQMEVDAENADECR